MLACIVGGALAVLAGGGCASGDAGRATRAATTTTPAEGPSRGPALALAEGAPVRLDDVRSALLEAGGGVVLEELSLDRALRRTYAERGLAWPGPDAIRRERALLIAALRDEAQGQGDATSGASSGASTDTSIDMAGAEELLRRVRRARGLGPTRFASLLERSAALRALVADAVRVDDGAVERELRLLTGPRVRARYFVHPSRGVVQDVLGALEREASVGGRIAILAERAGRESVDGSGASGGLLSSVSPDDAAIPGAVRAALGALRDGEVSGLLAVDGGFAVLLREGEAAPLRPGATREEATDRVRRRLERIAMDATATGLLRTSGVTAMDASLGWAWEGRE